MVTKTRKTPNKAFHDNPPTFTSVDRKHFFYIDAHFRDIISEQVRGNANYVFIIVAYGYFKATGQFFDSATREDVDYVTHRLKLDRKYAWKNYKKNTRDRHRELILSAQGYRPFANQHIKPLIQKLRADARAQKNPKVSFTNVCEWLFEHKVETPSFEMLTETIKSAYDAHREKQLAIVQHKLTVKKMEKLDSLFEKSKSVYDNMAIHRLTLLKKFKQSTKTTNIRLNLEAYDLLKPFYDIAKPIVQELDYSHDGLKRYAHSVNRRQVFQLKRLNDPDRHLHLVIFIVHQFHQLVDLLVDTLLVSIKSAVNKAETEAKEEYYRLRKVQAEHTEQLLLDTESLVIVMRKLRETLSNPTLSDAQKVENSLRLISTKKILLNDVSDNMNAVQEDLEETSGQALFMKYLEEGANSLSLKVNGILCRLRFESDDPNSRLFKALRYYQFKQGNINAAAPMGFISTSEKTHLDGENGFRKLLYKALLYKHIAAGLKCTTLNVIDSNRFRHLDEYLIPKQYFKQNRKRLLQLADMESFSDVDEVLDGLELQLDAQFKETNEHIIQEKNEHVEFDGLGGFKLASNRSTQMQSLPAAFRDIELFPKNKYIKIAEAVSTINTASNFLEEFESNSLHHAKPRPANKNFIAGIIALGEHFTVPKLSTLTNDIEKSSLESTTNGYFSLENIRRANDSIIRFVNQLPLSKLFESDFGFQTSSDGQKWSVAYESLNANKSFKYGGRDPVVSAYSFTDCRSLFTYSDVISGAEREAHYMVDGVLKNDVVKSDMHSTDTHGFSLAAYTITHLLKISFAPRIRQPGKSVLSSFRTRSYYKRRGYGLLPKHRVKHALVKSHWEEILRLVVSIKLGEVTASQMFKRLNSYAKRQVPLYDAIIEFGGIPKTLHILRFADDLEMRKAIQKQLNKGEAGNKLDKALAIGRKEYTQTLKLDQQVAESCKRLLKNVVVCWNFMYLSKKLTQCKTETERMMLLKKIKSSSMLAWEHFVFCGNYDFSDNALKDSQNFDIAQMMNPDLLE